MGGMVLETNLSQIITAISEQNKLQIASNPNGSSSSTSTSSSLSLTSATVAGKLLSTLSGIS